MADVIGSCETEITDGFEPGLLVGHEQRGWGKEWFAIDGGKMPSGASKEGSGTGKEWAAKRDKMKRQVVPHSNEHPQSDKKEGRDEESRKRTEQAIERVNKAHKKIAQCLTLHSPRIGPGKRPREVKSNITDKESATMTTGKGTVQGYHRVASVDKKHPVIMDAQAFGAGQEQPTLQAIWETMERTLPTMGGQRRYV